MRILFVFWSLPLAFSLFLELGAGWRSLCTVPQAAYLQLRPFLCTETVLESVGSSVLITLSMQPRGWCLDSPHFHALCFPSESETISKPERGCAQGFLPRPLLSWLPGPPCTKPLPA